MNRTSITMLSGLSLLFGIPSSCEGNPAAKASRIYIKIGAKTFTATLADNPAASAFKAMLPLTMKMSDLNDNEKVVDLSSALPSDDLRPGTIRTGI